MKLHTLPFLAVTVVGVMIRSSEGYSTFGVTTRRSTMSMKRGRGSFKKEVGSSGFSSSSSSSSSSRSSSAPTKRNWQLIPNQTTDALPKTEGKVVLMETNLESFKDSVANPTGAIAMIKTDGETFCFSSSCPSCKIPLTKAQVLPANDETAKTGKSPRIACDFCKATYNLKTGEKLKSQEATGLFGGIAKSVLSSQSSGPLPIYQLGEKDNQILISSN